MTRSCSRESARYARGDWVRAERVIAGDEMKLTRQIGDVATEQLVANRAKEVVNKAGIAIPGPLELLSIDEEKQHMDVNLLGRLAVCRPCCRSCASTPVATS